MNGTARPALQQNTPSGIAQQLRNKSSENVGHSNPEPMNIDDFIFSENASTPAGISFSPLLQPNHGNGHGNGTSDGGHKPIPTAVAAVAASNGIPIKSRKEQVQQQQQQQQLVPQSVPEPPHHHQSNEFGYVQRHLRKTSIDDRRVSASTVHTFQLFHFPLCDKTSVTAGFRFLCF